QQDVRLGRQLARDCQPLAPAAREPGDFEAAVEARAAESPRDLARARVLIRAGEGRRGHVLARAARRKVRILGHVAYAEAAAARAGAAVGRVEAREDPEQRGLSRSVGSHETRVVALEESERQLVEQDPRAVGLADRLAAQQKW